MQDGEPDTRLTGRIVKHGDAFAVLLSPGVAEELGLTDGDYVDVVAKDGKLPVTMRKLSVDELFDRIHAMRGLVPATYRFKREDAYDAD
jgi:antitoxin MazE